MALRAIHLWPAQTAASELYQALQTLGQAPPSLQDWAHNLQRDLRDALDIIAVQLGVLGQDAHTLSDAEINQMASACLAGQFAPLRQIITDTARRVKARRTLSPAIVSVNKTILDALKNFPPTNAGAGKYTASTALLLQRVVIGLLIDPTTLPLSDAAALAPKASSVSVPALPTTKPDAIADLLQVTVDALRSLIDTTPLQTVMAAAVAAAQRALDDLGLVIAVEQYVADQAANVLLALSEVAQQLLEEMLLIIRRMVPPLRSLFDAVQNGIDATQNAVKKITDDPSHSNRRRIGGPLDRRVPDQRGRRE